MLFADGGALHSLRGDCSCASKVEAMGKEGESMVEEFADRLYSSDSQSDINMDE